MTYDFGMYTEEGNLKMHKVAIFAKVYNLKWPEVLDTLRAISRDEPQFAEAMDTVVREQMFSFLGFDSNEVDFYA